MPTLMINLDQYDSANEAVAMSSTALKLIQSGLDS